MKYIFAALLLFCLTTAVSAEDGINAGRIIKRSGIAYSWIIPKDKMSSIIDWSPGSTEPPLSISKATEIARVYLNSPNQNFLSISLQRMYNDVSTKWMYVFMFEVDSPQNTRFPVGRIAILFNGNVIEPTIEEKR